ncbi:VOC family protein [Leisingera sp. F5]|uniref:VOC family protein n=1 Tax=Leisingera sp. F5 TaxID=1813816 RepID=UPI000A7CBB76|nr:VOC family protein [Leisingera sp. F5]
MDLSKLPSVVGGETLSNSFLGNAVELCIVTDDHVKTMEGLCRLGIGPWAVYTFSPETVSDQTYKGEPCEFALKVCFAQSGNMIWELMQPLWGPSIFQDFLDKHGTGFHHVAYDCNDEPWETRISELEKRGFKMVQSGKWQGQNAFAFFDTEDATGTTFETYHFPEGWDYPEPESWFPAPPPTGADL